MPENVQVFEMGKLIKVKNYKRASNKSSNFGVSAVFRVLSDAGTAEMRRILLKFEFGIN